MFIPLRHDRRLHSTPWLTMALIVANVVVFMATTAQIRLSGASNLEREALWLEFPVLKFYLWPAGDGFRWWQLFTAAFLHADFMHLAGNMLFLWIFGGAVEDRLGKIGYLAFYTAGAAAASGLYLATGPDGPMLGASGATTAVSGAFLVLFPQVRIQIVYWFIMIGSFEVPALWMLLGYFLKDAVFFMLDYGQDTSGGTAYAAHIGGFVLGILVASTLLVTKLLAREPQWDLWAMLQHWRRREKFRALAKNNGAPWLGTPAGGLLNANGKGKEAPLTPAILAARELIAKQPDLAQAAQSYAGLLALDPTQVFHEARQADLAGALMQAGRHNESAQAYRLLLAHYPRRADHAKTQLLLALLCQRYLGKPDEAKALLAEALPKLEGAEKAMAEGMLK